MKKSTFTAGLDIDDVRAHIARFPIDGDVLRMRKAFEALANLPVEPQGCCIASERHAGIDVDVVTPASGPGPATVVHLHGGGYVFGSPRTHRRLAIELAIASGCEVWLPDYPLAPEHPWPAQRTAVGDLLRVMSERTNGDVEHGTRRRLVVSGDSAGGHLAISVALASRPATSRPYSNESDSDGPDANGLDANAPDASIPEAGMPKANKRYADGSPIIDGLVLFSPNTLRDHALSVTRLRDAPRDAMNDPAQDDALARLAFGTLRPDDPEQTLVLASLASLPPIFLDIGADEILLDDALLFARAAALAGVAVDLHVEPAVFHLRQLFAQSWQSADQSLHSAGRWIDARVRFTDDAGGSSATWPSR